MKINNCNKFLWTFSLFFLMFSCTERIDIGLGNHEEKFIIECYIDDYENKAIGIFSMSKPFNNNDSIIMVNPDSCLLYTSPSPRDRQKSRMPSSA